MMYLVTLRCHQTGETQQEIMCEGCTALLAPLGPQDVQSADDDLRCEQCGGGGRQGPSRPSSGQDDNMHIREIIKDYEDTTRLAEELAAQYGRPYLVWRYSDGTGSYVANSAATFAQYPPVAPYCVVARYPSA